MHKRVQTGRRSEVLASDETLPDRFERIARAHNFRPALASESWQPTYGELKAASDLWAQAVAAHGGNQGDRVAILMRHDPRQVAAVLAVLKAGRIVVVLNATDAPARLRLTIADAAPALIITDASNTPLGHEIAQGLCACACCDDFKPAGADVPAPRLDPEATAFIVYTSGSAGRPKGVMMNHQQIIHNALRLSSAMALSAADRIALLPSLSGLHGVNNLWCALVHGALLLPFPVMERGVTGLAEWMADHKITAFSASTSLFRSFMRSMKPGRRLASVGVVRVGGELVTSDDFRAFQQHFSPDCILVNTLASSEGGNITYLRLSGRDSVPEGSMAVGHTFDDIEIEITDESGRPAADGEPGEIVVKSRYMSQGYWRNQALTAERYGRDSHGMPMLRSGDWGRINSAGVLEFVGRRDTRVKIHGSSVELDEVEQALRRAPGVERAVICAFEGAFGTRLAAYVVLRSGHTSSSPALRRAVRALLPEHMVPSNFQILDDLPLMPHGKVDRNKLLQTYPPNARQEARTAFETETEAVLAGIWSEAFDIPEVGRNDNFFELGGDSLISSLIAARVYGETGAELNLGSFVQYPTVASMAELVERLRQDTIEQFRIRPVPRDGKLPLSFAQHRIWQFSQTSQGLASYTHFRRYRIVGPLDVDVFRECINHLVKRHELLRTTFEAGDNGPVQIVHPPREVPLAFFDLTTAPDPAVSVIELMEQLARQQLDMVRGPLQRFTLVRLGENEHRLVRVVHHLLFDALSWKLLLDELAQLYDAATRGDRELSDGESLQYADYACWQREFFRAEAPACQNMIAWWKNALDVPPEPLDWPAKRREPAAGVAASEGYILTGIGSETWQRMADFANQQNATLYIVWLAAFIAFLCLQTGRRDIIIGTYVSNRKRPELQRMFGDFSNLVMLRFRCELDKTLRTWTMTARDTFTSTIAHSEVPYEELRRSFERDGKNLPEIRMLFSIDSPDLPIRFAGLEFGLEAGNPRPLGMPWGFSLQLAQQLHDCRFSFDASIYDPVAVHAMVGRWKCFVDALSSNPDVPIEQSLAMSEGD
jgi:amino acid adenylation domain-containing protein